MNKIIKHLSDSVNEHNSATQKGATGHYSSGTPFPELN